MNKSKIDLYGSRSCELQIERPTLIDEHNVILTKLQYIGQHYYIIE